MRLWILGAGGLLGSTLQQLCEKRKISFKATTSAQVDISDSEQIRRFAEAICPTHIVNCAAYTDVDSAEKEPLRAYTINATGPEYLAAIARKRGIRLVHVSTDYVFGGREKFPMREEEKCVPLGAYAQSKWEGEQRVLAELPTACIVRTSWLFGLGGKNFLSSLFQRILCEKVVRVVQDQIGRPTFCPDLGEAILSLLCHSGIYHFANEGELSRYQIAQDMWEEAKRRKWDLACKEIVPISSADFKGAPRPHYCVLHTAKVERILGQRPRSWKMVLSDFAEQLCVF